MPSLGSQLATIIAFQDLGFTSVAAVGKLPNGDTGKV